MRSGVDLIAAMVADLGVARWSVREPGGEDEEEKGAVRGRWGVKCRREFCRSPPADGL